MSTVHVLPVGDLVVGDDGSCGWLITHHQLRWAGGSRVMSWFRDTNGLWCACFQAYQPDGGDGCPANPCPEAHLSTPTAGAASECT